MTESDGSGDAFHLPGDPDTIFGETWDLDDRHNPQPLVYPVCSDCEEAYTYTRCLNFSTGEYGWYWVRPAKFPRQCRHKGLPKTVDTR